MLRCRGIMKRLDLEIVRSIAIPWICVFAVLVTTTVGGYAQNSHRWAFEADGGIQWSVQSGDGGHLDRIEMSGLQLSAIVQYGVSEAGQLALRTKLVFPMLRTIPNDTHASLQVDFNDLTALKIEVDGKETREEPRRLYLRGKLVVESDTQSDVGIKRELFPSTTRPAFVEIITVTNQGNQPRALRISNREQVVETDASKGGFDVVATRRLTLLYHATRMIARCRQCFTCFRVAEVCCQVVQQTARGDTSAGMILPPFQGLKYCGRLPRASLANSLCPGLLSFGLSAL
jgi:hypothetical protein